MATMLAILLAHLPIHRNQDLLRLCVLKSVEAEFPRYWSFSTSFQGGFSFIVYSGANVFSELLLF